MQNKILNDLKFWFKFFKNEPILSTVLISIIMFCLLTIITILLIFVQIGKELAKVLL